MTTIIASTNRANSNTLKVAKYYQNQLDKKGLPTRLFDLQELPLNFISDDLYGKKTEEFKKIQELITDTTKFLFVIPEYNGSYPGVLKTLIDACAFPESFYEKKACLVGISSGKYGNVRGIEHFSGVCSYLHLHVMPMRLHIPSVKNELDGKGALYLPETVKFTDQQMDKFMAY